MNIIENLINKKEKIAVVGLGYVGLPLAVLFGKKYSVIGFDINFKKISQLKKSIDKTGEVSSDDIKLADIYYTDNPKDLNKASIIIVTVPTPIDKNNIPDLTQIVCASVTVARQMRKGTIVVYESTVWPGLTEEVCIPILERESKMKWKKDFNVGYSPERINPGDSDHTPDKIKKVVAGDCQEVCDILSEIYGSVITAGVYKAPNIKTAEAAKVIENTQRDLNIAFVNELSIIFSKMGIDTKEVLDAASTKWNFLRFEPGLVGGHCIGVDPYYLTFKAQELGYHPEVILAGRRINDYMGKYVAQNTIKMIIKSDKQVKKSRVLILGITFKENIRDIRNSKVVDIYRELIDYGLVVDVYDPNADYKDVLKEYGIKMIDKSFLTKKYDAVIFAVKHKQLIDSFNLESFKKILNKKPILIDIKGIYDKDKALKMGYLYWRL